MESAGAKLKRYAFIYSANEYPRIITHLGMRLTQLKVIKLNYNCIETVEPLCSVWLKMAR